MIPPTEKGLQTIVAEPWDSMTTKTAGFGGMDERLLIVGPHFDGQGNLLFVEVQGGRVMRLSPNQDLTTILPKVSLVAAPYFNPARRVLTSR